MSKRKTEAGRDSQRRVGSREEREQAELGSSGRGTAPQLGIYHDGDLLVEVV